MRDNRFNFEKRWDEITRKHNEEIRVYNEQHKRPVYVSHNDQLKNIVKKYHN